MTKHYFPVETLRQFAQEVLVKVGVASENAAIIAETLVVGDLREVKSHGIVRLPTYVGRIEAGVMSANAPVETLVDTGSVALLDANNSFGQVAGHHAMKLAMEKAKNYGCGLVAVKNSNHFGITAYYSMLALEEDMVGIVCTNASPAMAPFRTKTPLLGTNPISFAVPAKKYPPIVLDMSTTVTARGRIRYAALTGQEIPLGWALDKDGKPTTDPHAALEGSLEPIGGVKGFGLSLIVDILCGILTANTMTGTVKNITDYSGPSKTGHFFMALDVSKFDDVDNFKNRVDAVIEKIKSLPSVDGGPIYMLGEIEHNNTQKNLQDGVPLDDEVVQQLNALAKKYGASQLKA
ncbi:MAG: Ldh family oxidoreductase [Firmicutes bacterium]|nr:Ldh family oxidoreductase [Bacillota bacterium]